MLSQRRPQWLGALAICGESITGLLHAALGFRRQRDAVTRDEFQQAENDGRVGGQLRGRAEIDALVGNREFRVGKARSPVAELRHQRTFASFVQVERATGVIVDHPRVAEILAHQIGRLAKRNIRLGGERLLRVEAEQVLIAPRLVMEKAAQRMNEFGGRNQPGGHFFIRLALFAQHSSLPSQSIKCRSRSPPGVSLMLGSR